REDLLELVDGRAKVIKQRWEWLKALRAMRPDDAAALAALVATMPAARQAEFAGKSHAEVLKVVTEAHALFYVSLRRQGIPISPDGALDKNDPALKDRKVGYDESPEAQAASRVFVGADGLLRRSDEGNPLVDTTNSTTHFSGAGVEIYVVGMDGDIHMHNHSLGQYHHSSLLDGGDVAMAGEMKVVKGKIQWLSDKSGHYVPSKDQMLQFLHYLKKDGVKLDFEVRGFALGEGKSVPATQLLKAAEGSTEDEWTSVKTKLVWDAFEKTVGLDKMTEALARKGWRSAGGGHAVVDKDDQPVPERDVRRQLKAVLGRSEPKVQRGVVDRSAPNGAVHHHVSWGETVTSVDELTGKRPRRQPAPPGAPAPGALPVSVAPSLAPSPAATTLPVVAADPVSDDELEGHYVDDEISLEPEATQGRYVDDDEIRAQTQHDDSDHEEEEEEEADEREEEHGEDSAKDAEDEFFYIDPPTEDHGEDSVAEDSPAEPNYVDPVMDETASEEGGAGAFYRLEDEPGTPSTPHTALLARYEASTGPDTVAEVLRRQALYLDTGTGHVREQGSHRALTLEELTAALRTLLGPLADDAFALPSAYAYSMPPVPAASYTQLSGDL
ncbi:MAG: hypothetical protein ACTHQ3_21740, partial [Motilibacteraceae bacterium]